MFMMQEIGKKIVALRKEKNMTQMELADLMGISFQAVSNWERGETMPDISKLPELAQILGVTVDKLLGDTAEERKEIQKEGQKTEQKETEEKKQREAEKKEETQAEESKQQETEKKEEKEVEKSKQIETEEKDFNMIKKNILPLFKQIMEDKKRIKIQEEFSMIKKNIFPLFTQITEEKKLVNQQEIEIDEIQDITVDYSCDNIVFYPSENGKLVLKEYMNQDNEEYYAQITRENEKIKILSGKREKIGYLQTLIEIYIPVDFHGNLKAKTNSGSLKINLEQAFSNFKAETSSGSIKINSVQAEQSEIQANSGSIKIDKVDGKFNISTCSGSIKIVDCKGKGNLSTNSGSIKFETCNIEGEIKSNSGSIKGEILYTDRVTLYSNSGSIKITELRGEFLINCSSGLICIESCDGNGELNTTSGSIRASLKNIHGNIKAHTNSGSIKVDFQENIDAQIEARSKSGMIRVQNVEIFEKKEHFVKGVLGKGGETVISLDTHSGSIRIG